MNNDSIGWFTKTLSFYFLSLILGAINIGAGGGDYLNIFHALTQMPRGALCFMSKNRSYWYLPGKEEGR